MNCDMEIFWGIIFDKVIEIIIIKFDEVENNIGKKDIFVLIVKENKKFKENGEEGLLFDMMWDQIMMFLGVGYDIIVMVVVWIVYFLLMYFEIQSKFCEEIWEYMFFLFDVFICYDFCFLVFVDLDKFFFMDNVCRELLRYIFLIFMIVRQFIVDDILGWYKVLGGIVIYVFVNMINWFLCYWGEMVDEFDLDRWDDLLLSVVLNVFMIFLQGLRGCIGWKFVEMEMKILLCVLLSEFEFGRDYEMVDLEEWKMWRLVLRFKEGVMVRVFLLGGGNGEVVIDGGKGRGR